MYTSETSNDNCLDTGIRIHTLTLARPSVSTETLGSPYRVLERFPVNPIGLVLAILAIAILFIAAAAATPPEDPEKTLG